MPWLEAITLAAFGSNFSGKSPRIRPETFLVGGFVAKGNTKFLNLQAADCVLPPARHIRHRNEDVPPGTSCNQKLILKVLGLENTHQKKNGKSPLKYKKKRSCGRLPYPEF